MSPHTTLEPEPHSTAQACQAPQTRARKEFTTTGGVTVPGSPLSLVPYRVISKEDLEESTRARGINEGIVVVHTCTM